MRGLTKRQREVIDYIQEFSDTQGYSPSYREIMEHFSYASPGTVYKLIHTLQRKGALSVEKGCSRSLLLTQSSQERKNATGEVELPLLGHISADNPIETFAQVQTIAVPRFLVPSAPGKTYVLRVQGDSLEKELIADGDLLLVEARQEIYSGETIVARMGKETTMIRRYYPEGKHIRLESLKTEEPPLTLPEGKLNIQGVLISLLRVP